MIDSEFAVRQVFMRGKNGGTLFHPTILFARIDARMLIVSAACIANTNHMISVRIY